MLLCVLLALDAASAQPLYALRPLFLALSGSTLVQTSSPPVRHALGVRTPRTCHLSYVFLVPVV